jgi:regulatory protein YycH of two-component signal transduction system YycFG
MRVKVQWETVKTWMLTLLVLLSVVLSFKLWYSIPVYEPVDSPSYVGEAVWGPGKTVAQVLQPVQIRVHLGDGRHTVVSPDSEMYRQLFELLRKADVSAFAPVSWSDALWESIVSKRSVEYDYGMEVQAQYLVQTLSLPSGLFSSLKARTLYLFYDPEGNLRLLLKGDAAAYWSKVQLPEDLLQQTWNQASKQPMYAMYGKENQAFYLPMAGMKIPSDTYERNAFNTSQLMSSFFVDPTLTRRIVERNGSVIVTDGSRGVQFSTAAKTVDYTNPGADGHLSEEETDHSLEKAIEFVNDHGGMSGTYRVSDGAKQKDITSSYLFQRYINGLPLRDPYFSIRVKMRGNTVFELIRPIVYLGSSVKREEVEILSGPRLLEALQKRGIQAAAIRDACLSYVPESVEKDRLRLRPVWWIERRDGSPVYVDAASGDLWADNGGWLNGLE